MLSSGNICIWDNAGILTRVIILDGAKPVSDFRRPVPARRLDHFALVAVLSSGECAIAHVDDLVPLVQAPCDAGRILDRV